ncbi:MAG TPA: nucleotidyltransferase domain-containing protein [Candidatus Paceibacterota bacterium]|nr:nucleotidyltransferase domain-containing protein [Candidatus Paceibacterota bacterium]
MILPTFTKNQILILELFFNHPDDSYYLRQISRFLNKKPGVFQKDINKLVENGILESYYQGNNRFFKINKNYPLYQDLKNIFFKTVGIKGELERILKNIKGIKSAFIYGSFAKGEEQKRSDIDLCIIGSVDENSLIKKLTELEKKINREINYILLDEREYVNKLKNKDSFLKNITKQDKIYLI